MSNLSYKWLESARLLRQKTQKDAASVAGISQGKLSKAERGDQTLPDETLRILADYYDVPLIILSRMGFHSSRTCVF